LFTKLFDAILDLAMSSQVLVGEDDPLALFAAVNRMILAARLVYDVRAHYSYTDICPVNPKVTALDWTFDQFLFCLRFGAP
jgi:hypothetical protein